MVMVNVFNSRKQILNCDALVIYVLAFYYQLEGDLLSPGRPPSRGAWWLLLVQWIPHRASTLPGGCPGPNLHLAVKIWFLS